MEDTKTKASSTSHAEKITKLQQTIARQKIWLKDRKNFLKLCKLIGITDCELVFEAAAAKDAPIDLDELLQGASHVVEAKRTLTDFHEYVEMTLGETLNDLDIKTLKHKWLSQQSESSAPLTVNVLHTVHEQIQKQAQRIEELELQTSLHESRECASVSTCMEQCLQKDVSSQTDNDTENGVKEQLEILNQKLKESQREASEIAAIKQSKIDSLEAELRHCRKQCTDAEDRLATLQNERNKYNFVEELASKQAERDATIASLTFQIEDLKKQKGISAEELDSRRIFATSIFLKFVAYAMLNDFDKMKSLVPVTKELFHLSDTDAYQLSELCSTETSSGITSWLPPFS